MRRARGRLVTVLLTGVLAIATDIASATVPSGCTSIRDVPVSNVIGYGAAIQGLFNNFDGTNGCIDCHFTPPGSSGNLDLSAGPSWHNLVNVPSDEDDTIDYVVPNHPEQSLLFRKLNCDSPGVGGRMPRNFPNLTAEQQALIYDWIAGGAPVGTTSEIFRNGFDFRGFSQ